MFKRSAVLILFAFILATTACRKEEFYTRVNIVGVEVSQHPATPPTGGDWDDPLGSFLPDIYVGFFVEGTTNQLYSVGAGNRYENVSPNSTFSWNTSYTMSNSDVIDIDLYDFDSVSSDDYMGTVTFDPILYVTGDNTFPPTVRLSDNGITLTLTLQWLE